MKKLMTILCLLCFAGCAYAEVYEIPGSQVTTTTEVTQENTQQDTKTERKWVRKKRKEYKPMNSYWNFGKVPFWTGTI